MATVSRSRAADRAGVIKKLVPILKKQYKVPVSNHERTVLDTMLYAVCLENVAVPVAEASFATLLKEFPDLNEARVSSITELQRIFVGQVEPDWRAFRIRSILQFVFEKGFTYEFEGLRKKTLELAQKQLAKVRHLTPFIRNYTLHYAIGAHVLPLDDYSLRALNWLGLTTADQSADEISESFRATIRKAEAELFCYSVRALATDPEVAPTFDPEQFSCPADGWDAVDGIERLQLLLKHGFAAYKLKYGIPAAKAEKPTKGEKVALEKPVAQKQTSEKTHSEKSSGDKAPADKSAVEKVPTGKSPAGKSSSAESGVLERPGTSKQSGDKGALAKTSSEKHASEKSGKFEKPVKGIEAAKTVEPAKTPAKKSAPEAKPVVASKTTAPTVKAAAKSGKFEKPVAGKTTADKSSNESGKAAQKKVEPKKVVTTKDAPAAKASNKSGTHAKPSAASKASSSAKSNETTKKPAPKKSK